jgi:hypothetical protein
VPEDPVISGQGQVVAISPIAAAAVPNDTNTSTDAFVIQCF